MGPIQDVFNDHGIQAREPKQLIDDRQVQAFALGDFGAALE